MIARKTFLIMGSRIFMSFMGYLSWYFITYHVSKEFVGSVGYAIGILGLLGLFTDLGFSTAHIKKVSEGKDIGKCIGTYLTIKLVMLSAFVILLFSAFWFYQNVYPQKGFENSYDLTVIYIMLGWTVLSNLSQVPLNTFIGKQEMAKAELGLVVASFLQSLVTIIIVLRYDDVYLLSLTWVLGALITFVISYIQLFKTKVKLPEWALFKEYAKFSLPLMIVASSAPIVANIDKVMVKFFWSNSDVSVYWNAQKFAQLPDDLTAALATVLFPAFSALIAAGSISEVKRLTYLSEKYISMAIVPIALIFIAIAHPFILLYSGGPQYSRSAGVLVFLMMWVILRALSRPYIAHFGSFDKPVYSLVLTVIYIPLNIATNLILIPDSFYGIKMAGLGAEGAALATLLAALINYGIIRYLSRRLIRTSMNISVIKHLVAGGISACGLYLFQMLVYRFDHFYDIPIFTLLAFAVYLALLYLMREFRKNDRDFFLDTLHVGKMGRYIIREVFRK